MTIINVARAQFTTEPTDSVAVSFFCPLERANLINLKKVIEDPQIIARWLEPNAAAQLSLHEREVLFSATSNVGTEKADLEKFLNPHVMRLLGCIKWLSARGPSSPDEFDHMRMMIGTDFYGATARLQGYEESLFSPSVKRSGPGDEVVKPSHPLYSHALASVLRTLTNFFHLASYLPGPARTRLTDVLFAMRARAQGDIYTSKTRDMENANTLAAVVGSNELFESLAVKLMMEAYPPVNGRVMYQLHELDSLVRPKVYEGVIYNDHHQMANSPFCDLALVESFEKFVSYLAIRLQSIVPRSATGSEETWKLLPSLMLENFSVVFELSALIRLQGAIHDLLVMRTLIRLFKDEERLYIHEVLDPSVEEFITSIPVAPIVEQAFKTTGQGITETFYGNIASVNFPLPNATVSMQMKEDFAQRFRREIPYLTNPFAAYHTLSRKIFMDLSDTTRAKIVSLGLTMGWKALGAIGGSARTRLAYDHVLVSDGLRVSEDASLEDMLTLPMISAATAESVNLKTGVDIIDSSSFLSKPQFAVDSAGLFSSNKQIRETIVAGIGEMKRYMTPAAVHIPRFRSSSMDVTIPTSFNPLSLQPLEVFQGDEGTSHIDRETFVQMIKELKTIAAPPHIQSIIETLSKSSAVSDLMAFITPTKQADLEAWKAVNALPENARTKMIVYFSSSRTNRFSTTGGIHLFNSPAIATKDGELAMRSVQPVLTLKTRLAAFLVSGTYDVGTKSLPAAYILARGAVPLKKNLTM